MASLRSQLENIYLKERGFGSGRAYTNYCLESENEGVLLDLGCGEGKLRQQLSPSMQYVGIDRYFGEQSNEYTDWSMAPNIVADIHNIPIKNCTCKKVVLNHVLEHVIDPGKVLKEIFRILHPQGLLFIDVPFFHEIHHAPHDYQRFTRYGLEAIAQESGFEIVEIKPSGGYFRTLSYTLQDASYAISADMPGRCVLRALVGAPLKCLGFLIGKAQYVLDLYDSRQVISCGYHAIFKKPGLEE